MILNMALTILNNIHAIYHCRLKNETILIALHCLVNIYTPNDNDVHSIEAVHRIVLTLLELICKLKVQWSCVSHKEANFIISCHIMSTLSTIFLAAWFVPNCSENLLMTSISWGYHRRWTLYGALGLDMQSFVAVSIFCYCWSHMTVWLACCPCSLPN